MKNIFKKVYEMILLIIQNQLQKNKVIHKKFNFSRTKWMATFSRSIIVFVKSSVDKYKCKIIGYDNFELLNYKKISSKFKWFLGSKF